MKTETEPEKWTPEKIAFASQPWSWTDQFSRLDGSGERIANNVDNEPFEHCVIDSQGFVVARVAGCFVTMSSDASNIRTRLFSVAPEMYSGLDEIARRALLIQCKDPGNTQAEFILQLAQKLIRKVDGK